MESGETIFRLVICLVIWRLVRSVDFARAVPGGTPKVEPAFPQSNAVEDLPGRIFDAMGRINLWLSAQLSLSVLSGSVAVIPIGLVHAGIRRFAAEYAGVSPFRLCDHAGWRTRREEFL